VTRIFLSISLLFLFNGCVTAETFYVRKDISHSVTRNGLSYDTAWGGWGEVQWGSGVGKVGAGDTLYVCGSHSYAAPISIGASGTSSTSKIIIDGGYATESGTITLVGATYIACPRDYISFDNITITGGTSSCVYDYNANRNGIYFNKAILDGGSTGLLLPANYNVTDVKIDGCTFQNQTSNAAIRWLAATPATDTGILSDVDITNTTFQNISGSAIELRIESDCPVAHVSDIVVSGCDFSNVTGWSCYVGGGTQTAGVNNHNSGYVQVFDNTFTSVADAIVVIGASASEYGHNKIYNNTISTTTKANGPINLFQSQYVDVYYNYIHDSTTTTIDGNGILIDYGNEHVRVYRNRIDNMLGKAGVDNSGCAIMVLNSKNVYVYNNYGSGSRNGLYVGDVSVSAGELLSNINFFNNTFTGCTSIGIDINSSLDATDVAQVTFQNNILTADGVGKGIDDNSTGGADPIHTNNCLYNFATTYEGITAGVDETTSNPLFRSPTDYHLTKNSPVKTSGIALPEVREDYDGNPRPLSGGCSMGAFQWNKAIIRGNTTIKNATL
jgi:hypothetical protein